MSEAATLAAILVAANDKERPRDASSADRNRALTISRSTSFPLRRPRPLHASCAGEAGKIPRTLCCVAAAEGPSWRGRCRGCSIWSIWLSKKA
eukprot:4140966-Pleurochrysis_carterae.AAC.1